MAPSAAFGGLRPRSVSGKAALPSIKGAPPALSVGDSKPVPVHSAHFVDLNESRGNFSTASISLLTKSNTLRRSLTLNQVSWHSMLPESIAIVTLDKVGSAGSKDSFPRSG